MDHNDYERYHQQKKEHWFTPHNGFERMLYWYVLIQVVWTWLPVIF